MFKFPIPAEALTIHIGDRNKNDVPDITVEVHMPGGAKFKIGPQDVDAEDLFGDILELFGVG